MVHNYGLLKVWHTRSTRPKREVRILLFSSIKQLSNMLHFILSVSKVLLYRDVVLTGTNLESLLCGIVPSMSGNKR